MSFKLGDILRVKPEILNRVDRCPSGKTVFHSKREANDKAKSNNVRERTPQSAYCCDICGKYHLGHRRGQVW